MRACFCSMWIADLIGSDLITDDLIFTSSHGRSRSWPFCQWLLLCCPQRCVFDGRHRYECNVIHIAHHRTLCDMVDTGIWQRSYHNSCNAQACPDLLHYSPSSINSNIGSLIPPNHIQRLLLSLNCRVPHRHLPVLQFLLPLTCAPGTNLFCNLSWSVSPF